MTSVVRHELSAKEPYSFYYLIYSLFVKLLRAFNSNLASPGEMQRLRLSDQRTKIPISSKSSVGSRGLPWQAKRCAQLEAILDMRIYSVA